MFMYIYSNNVPSQAEFKEFYLVLALVGMFIDMLMGQI